VILFLILGFERITFISGRPLSVAVIKKRITNKNFQSKYLTIFFICPIVPPDYYRLMTL
jgi:hypothetical protein